MKVGDYVRTKRGLIGRITNVNTFREPCMKYGIEASYLHDIWFIGDDDIKLVKEKPIDLIEVGDYVNGSKVLDIAQAPKKAIYTEQENGGALLPIVNNRIDSILTKEQFKNMEYKVGD